MQTKLGTPCRPKHELKTRGTEILYDQSSIVLASVQSLDNVTAPQSLVIATLAYLYSKLENAKYWNGAKLDDIIRLGVVYHDKWSDRKDSQAHSLNMTTIPTTIDLYGFRVNIDLTSGICRGELMENVPFHCSALNCGLSKCFRGTKTVGVIIEATTVAVVLWRSKGMYYMLNVFACDNTGKYAVDNGCACILMNNRLSELIGLLAENLSRICQAKSTFVLHDIRVCDVNKIERNEYFNDDDVQDWLQEPTKNTELSSAAQPAPPLVIPDVPQHELSDLSVCGGKRKKRQTPINESVVPQEAFEPSQTTIIIDKMLIDECEMTLEYVLDKVDDKIELKCIDEGGMIIE